MKKAIVTGGAGFIGSHLVDALLDEAYHVLVVDDFSSGTRENLAEATARAGGRLSVIYGDVRSAEIVRPCLEFQPTEIFHLAAQMNVRRSVQDPQFDAEVNVVGTVQMLEIAKEAGVSTFFLASTGGAIYGEQERFPADEHHRICPESPYGVSKRAAELYLEYFARTSGFQSISMRFANVYGPRQNPKGEAGVVAIFARRLIAGEPLTIYGDGEQTRDFVFVGDVVRAHLGVLGARREKSPFLVYNVGRGIECSVNDVAKSMSATWKRIGPAEVKGRDVVINYAPGLPGEQRRSVIDAKRLSHDTGWQATIDLDAGLKATLESFVESTPK